MSITGLKTIDKQMISANDFMQSQAVDHKQANVIRAGCLQQAGRHVILRLTMYVVIYMVVI